MRWLQGVPHMRQCFCPGVPIPAPCGAFQQSASSIPCSPPIAQSAAGSRPPPKPPSRPTRHLIPAQDYLNVIPAKVSPPFLQNSPSFPRRRESITEQPILNELARCGLLYAFPRGSVGTREKQSPDQRGYNLSTSLLFLLFPWVSHPWQPGRP